MEGQITEPDVPQIKSFHSAIAEWRKNYPGSPLDANWISIRAMELFEAETFHQLPVTRPTSPKDVLVNQHRLQRIRPLTGVIQIVAPGPSAPENLHKLDGFGFTIVVNKACELPGAKNLWMVEDGTVYEDRFSRCKWFQYGLESCHDIACFDSGYLYEKCPDIPYTFESAGQFSDYTAYTFNEKGISEPHRIRTKLYHGYLRGDSTISCKALQLSYMLGAKEIRLCGVDMMKNEYFDGSKTVNADREEGGNYWDYAIPRFNSVIKYIQGKGVRIVSLSPTALDLEVINGGYS